MYENKDSTVTYRLRGGSTINDGSWHHVAVISNDTAISIYIDGIAETIVVDSGSNNGNWFGEADVVS